MVDRAFRIDLERSRIYWSYYKSMFKVFSTALTAGMVCAAIIYTKGEINLTMTAAVIGLLFLCIILLSALMSLIIWRHENRHFDEMTREDEREFEERPPTTPLV